MDHFDRDHPLTPGPVSSAEIQREVARLCSYTDACVWVIVLYFILFIPGVIANYLYLQDARRMERIAGQSLPGVSGLRFMWTLFQIAAGFVGLVVAALVIAIILTPRP